MFLANKDFYFFFIFGIYNDLKKNMKKIDYYISFRLRRSSKGNICTNIRYNLRRELYERNNKRTF